MKIDKLISSKDMAGHGTLILLSKAKRFNKWMYQSIKPWIRGNVFEIGSGIGNITTHMLDDGHHILMSETNESYLQILQDKFRGKQNVVDIILMNIVDPDFDQTFSHLLDSFDTVIANNVIEHIEDDLCAFRNAKKLLNPGGRFILLLPNSVSLYNELDKNLDHYRRYNINKVKDIFDKIELMPISYSYFNAIGIAGWFFSGSILKNKTIPAFMIRIFECIIPYTSWIDKLFKKRFGLSLIVVGRRANEK